MASFIVHFSFLMLLVSASAAVASKKNLIRTSCTHASFPNICVRSLTSYPGPANTPRDLAQAALKVSLCRSHRASAKLAALRARTRRERSALDDCVEQVGDSVDELRKSLKELQGLHRETFRWQMSNVETWVSAALTNDDTCLDGFREVDGKNVRADIKRRITNVARVTSNALYMINQLDHSKGISISQP